MLVVYHYRTINDKTLWMHSNSVPEKKIIKIE